jgi:hypothetical protein
VHDVEYLHREGGVALTPPLDAGLLAGLTREFVFEVGQQCGVMVREQVLRDADLFGADEAFLTSTTRELVPIVRVDDRTIGSGRPGPVTAKLLQRFREHAKALTSPRASVSTRISDLAVVPLPVRVVVSLDLRGFRSRNPARMGDTLWVRRNPSPFSSPSTGF